MAFNFPLYEVVFAVNLLSINTATVYSWTSPSIPILSSNDTSINPLGRPITTFEESCITSLASVGSVIGTLLSGFVAEKYGRKKTLFAFSIPFVVFLAVIANANHIYLFYLARLVLGISAGCVLNNLPSYVAEIAEDSNRGTLGGIFGFINGIGHLFCFGIGPLVSIQVFAYILMIPVTCFLITYFFLIPESPRFLINKNDYESARNSLTRLRKITNIDKELEYLITVERDTEKVTKPSWKDILSSPVIIRGLFISCTLFLFQQTTGVGFLLAFLQQILNASGGVILPSVACIVIGVVQVIFSLVSTVLMDRAGRKVLLCISSIGCCCSMLSVGLFFYLKDHAYNVDTISWLPLASLIGFYVFLGVGYASIPWIMCGELFATDVKSFCVTTSTAICLLLSAVVNGMFPILRDTLGMGEVFIIFGVITGLSTIFHAWVVPETKGKSLEEIQIALGAKPNPIITKKLFEHKTAM